MKIIVRHHLHEPSRSLSQMLETELEALRPSLQIDEARVLVERRPGASPEFHVAVHLVTPGPDVIADSVDHTLRAAVRKAFGSLENKIGHRTEKRRRRLDAEPAAAREPRTRGHR